MPFIGEIIAITTVLCWTISVQFFGAASKRVGAIPVNIIRLFVALVLFTIFLLIRDGALVPLNFSPRAWFYLGLSGITGFFIGDIFLFKALVVLGPRLAMLIHSLAAPTAALIGWAFLGENYAAHQWFGIFVTLAGVSIVIFEKSPAVTPTQRLTVRKVSVKGVLYGFGAMIGQAVGYIFSKVGMQTDSGYLDAFSSTQIRAIVAFVCFFLFFTITRKWGNVWNALHDKQAVVYTSIGAAVGPFLGVSLSLLVLHYLATGVAATFLSLVPIAIIPFSIFLHKEHVSKGALGGTFIAIFGIYLLMS